MRITRATYINLALKSIGAPLYGQNRLALHAKAIQEWGALSGHGPTDNLLDLTQPMPGATPFNTFDGNLHVWNYRSITQGIEAFRRIMQGYPQILAMLRTYHPAHATIAKWNTPPNLKWGHCNPAFIDQAWKNVKFYDGLIVPDAKK